MIPIPVFLLGEFPGQRNLVGYSLWGQKESDTTEQGTLSPHFIRYLFLCGLFKFKNCAIPCILTIIKRKAQSHRFKSKALNNV